MKWVRRAGRWRRRTAWMARTIAADMGRRRTNGPPAWRRDNPFFGKTLRAESRRPFLFIRLALTVATLALLLLGGMALERRLGFGARGFMGFLGVSPLGLAFLAVSLAHTLFVLGARGALATSLQAETRRQTLDGLLLTPMPRAAMLLAMAVAPALGAGLVALAGLPVYVLLNQLGGAEWRDIGLLYVLFGLAAFAPPSYAVPALSGAAATPDAPQMMAAGRAQEQRRAEGASAAGWSWFSLVWTFIALRPLLGMMGGSWLGHGLSVLPSSVTRLGPLVVFAWPYSLTQTLGAPLPFYNGHLVPFVYALPLIFGGWISSVLKSAAALTAGSAQEMVRLGLFRRHAALARMLNRIALLCFLGVVWRVWVLGGDTGGLTGHAVPDPNWGAAGLLLLLGSIAQIQAAWRALGVAPRGKSSGRLRPPVRLVRRALRLAWRPLRLAVWMFGLACVLGGLSPFVGPVFWMAGRLALVALTSVIFVVGFHVWAASFEGKSGDKASARVNIAPGALAMLLFALPLAALSVPDPRFWGVAALSPATAWLRQFADAQALLNSWPYWKMGLLPPFGLAVAAPIVAGLLLGASGHARAKRRFAPPVSAPTVAAPVPPAAPARHAARTAALLAWVTARTDNPLFTHELRVRTRSGLWFSALYVAPLLLLLLVSVAVRYPDYAHFVSFTALLHPFRQGGFASGPPPPVFADLAAILQSWQVYVCALNGQTIGENLIVRDQQRGTLGFLLLTPLRAGQIFWGKVWGQTTGFGLGQIFLCAASLLLTLLAAPAVGLKPALMTWATTQALALSLLTLSVSLGAALATHALLLKSLRGVSTLLVMAALAGGVWLVLRLTPDEASSWPRLVIQMEIGSLCAFAVSVPAFAYALWRFRALRRKDIPFGDQAAG